MSSKQKLELTWIGKGKSPELEPRILIEYPGKSYGDAKTENMLIHGDNLLALKALEQDFSGKIKCVYIDPPFNTGAAFEHYDDGLEHSIWLDLMKQRLMLLKNLISEDGFIVVHLDDTEAAYCKILLDEVFGRSNYLNQIITTTNKPFGFKSTSESLFKQANHLLFYAKNKPIAKLNSSRLFIEKEYDPQYKYVFENMEYPESEWRWKNIADIVSTRLNFDTPKVARKNMGDDVFENEVALYAIQHADSVFRTASVSGGALIKRKETIEKSKKIKDKIVRHPNDDMDYMFIGGERVLFYKERLVKIDDLNVPGELITDVWTDISIEGIAKEGGVDFPKGKKPEKLISRIIDITTKESEWILDSFLGSGTTAAVSHKMNRKWIGIELGDQCYTHCLSRLKAVINGDDQSGISKTIGWKGGGGFKYYELAPSLLKQDKFGNWVIAKEYNADMLAAAMAKQEGFNYCPSEEIFWKQGRSTEKDFIFTTTNMVTVEQLDSIGEDMKEDEHLLICCKSYQKACSDKYAKIDIKKIPKMLLGKCEFGKDDYSLNIINMPFDPDAPEFKPSGPPDERKLKRRKDMDNSQPDLFAADEEA